MGALDEPARRELAGSQPASLELTSDERWSMVSYLAVPFLSFLVPLTVYVIKRQRSAFVRYQAAQALNLSVTGLLYSICVLILGGVLALDSLNVAVLAAIPLIAALWLTSLGYVVRAAAAAGRGDYYRIPAWICATMARPGRTAR
jgi:uncharacterized Tic20 family protein